MSSTTTPDAPVFVAKTTGGRITDFADGPYAIYKKEILASNGRIHEEMLEVLKLAAS